MTSEYCCRWIHTLFILKKVLIQTTAAHDFEVIVCWGYLGHDGRSVSGTSDEDDEGPVVRVHEDAGCLGAGGVEGCGTSAVGALDAAALHLPLHPFPAVHALLRRGTNQELKITTWGLEEKRRRGPNFKIKWHHFLSLNSMWLHSLTWSIQQSAQGQLFFCLFIKHTPSFENSRNTKRISVTFYFWREKLKKWKWEVSFSAFLFLS